MMASQADKMFRKGGVSGKKNSSDIGKLKPRNAKPKNMKAERVGDMSKKFRSRKP